MQLDGRRVELVHAALIVAVDARDHTKGLEVVAPRAVGRALVVGVEQLEQPAPVAELGVGQ